MATEPLLGRFRVVPLVLYRVQGGRETRLREHGAQQKLKRHSFDLRVYPDGLVHPNKTDTFIGPNGASLRPMGPVLKEVLATFRGRRPFVFTIPKDTPVPTDLVLLHEHTDHYSLQCDRPMPLSELNARLTRFLADCRSQTLDEFLKEHPVTTAF
eukprot:Unigene7874_Nuclearia_a/m.24187 Unigene7874_Nuclearia_a/g.24187  ORF Unigene7874_Nuclearia_a/g.24187 Unigene7874_Nuclearia_a/m.24187 type:complete len:155 (-) Unigene7874_Nuclearia_a:57-521(-)